LVTHGRTVVIGTMFKFATSLSRSLLSGCFGRPGRPGSWKVHPVEDEWDHDEMIVLPKHGDPFKTFDSKYIFEMSIDDILFDHRYCYNAIVKRIPVKTSDPNFDRIFDAYTLYLTPDVELMIRMMTEKGYYDRSLISDLVDVVCMESRGFSMDETEMSAMKVFEHVARVMLRERE
jgi:hypothetical protein